MDYAAGAGSAFIAAFGLAMLGMICSIPLLMVFRWWSEGQVNGGEALGLVVMFLLMFACLLGPAPAALKGIIAVIMFGAAVGLAGLPILRDKRDVVQFEEEKEAVYRAAMEANPRNIPARVQLARSLHEQKRLSEAIETLEMAIQLSPSTTEKEKYLLKTWLAEQENRPKSIMICRWCRQDTPLDRPNCVHCGRPIRMSQEMADAIMEDIPGMIRSFLILIPILLVVGFVISHLGSALGGMIIIGILMVAGLWWVRQRL